ncbi:MAG: hypothetical protein ACRELC_08970 [Gemmatimonadota bacterium]
MRKQRFATLALVGAMLALTACGGGRLTVEVRTETGGEMQPVEDLEVQFLPFDRDSLFEVLAESASEPEPQIPASLRAQFDSVAALQEAWRTAEAEWGEVRDELRQLSDRLRGLDPRSRGYRESFDRFNELEARERQLNRQRQESFDRFTTLQQAAQVRMDSVRAVIEAWENVAFEDYGSMRDSIIEALGRELYYDTTDASGSVSRRLPGGAWWVYTRVAVPNGELYWNVALDPGQTDTLRLTVENAERRLAF